MQRSVSSKPGARRWATVIALLALASLAALLFSAEGSAAARGSSDLRITKTDGPDPVHVGATLTYTIGVQNLGPQGATGVTITDQLPRGVDLLSATASSGQCALHGRKVSCRLGSVGFGANYGPPPALSIAVVPRRTGRITNTATVKADQKDPVAANNLATASTRVLATATCRGVPATITGTGGDDVLTGTGGPDVIVGFGGNDTIHSFAGRDLICAGAGNDYVAAGTAADRVFGGSGRDRLLGRGGPDLLKGNAGNDLLKGGRGSDRLRGGHGFYRCIGGRGRDSFHGCERKRR